MSKLRPIDYEGDIDELKTRFQMMTKPHIRTMLSTGQNCYPEYLYKYLSSDIKIEHLRCLLIDSDFYLNSCSSFNDPFDTTAHLREDYKTEELRKRFKDIVKRNNDSLSNNQTEIETSRLVAKCKSDPNYIRSILTQNLEAIGIHCLTESPDNILMWSHYGNNHQGVVFEFEIAEDPISLLYAIKIEYSEEYPIYDFTHKNQEDVYKKIILRKAKAWDYENEWRIIRIRSANTFQPFKPSALTGIIFGCKAKDSFKDKILGVLKERSNLNMPEIKIYNSVMHKSNYKLEITN